MARLKNTLMMAWYTSGTILPRGSHLPASRKKRSASIKEFKLFIKKKKNPTYLCQMLSVISLDDVNRHNKVIPIFAPVSTEDEKNH